MKFTIPEVINDDEIRERQAKILGLKSQKTVAKTMPTFPKDVSAMPHCIARSALFSPIRRGRRQYRRQELIASRDDVSISYTGEQLDMADQDVFLQAVKVAQGEPAGELCLFERADFLRSIGRAKNKQNYLWLDKSLERLASSASLKIETKNYKAVLSLINGYGLDKETGNFFLQLNPEVAKVYEAYGHIDIQKRKLIKHDFTKWLQGYVSSHEKGKHTIGIDKLHAWSGSETLLKKWKLEKLKPALAELEKLGIIKMARIVDKTAEWKRI